MEPELPSNPNINQDFTFNHDHHGRQDDLQKPQFKVEIDFEDAAKQWRSNKILHNSAFSYCCGVLKPNGKFCKGPPAKWAKNLRAQNDFPDEWGPCKRHLLDRP